MKQLNRKNNFIYLFVSLILFLFMAALLADFSNLFSKGVFALISLLMLLGSLRSLHRNQSWKYAIYILFPVLLGLSVLEFFFPLKLYHLLVLSTLLLFFIGSFFAAMRQVLFEGDIDSNKIVGSLTLYILLGLIWAVIYMIILVIDPTAFSGIEVHSWQEAFSRVAYYSFVTLTTLGYGDILPKQHIAEFFAYMEAVVGVFYIAIIVSSLISLRLAAIQREHTEPKK